MLNKYKELLTLKNIGLILLTIFLLIVMLFYSFTILENKFRTQVVDSLDALKTTTYNSVKDVWFKNLAIDFNDRIDQPYIFNEIEKITKAKANKNSLIKPNIQDPLRKIFKNYIRDRQARGYFVINRQGLSIASMRDSNIGTTNLIYKFYPDIFEKVFTTKKAQLIPVIFSDVPLINQKGVIEENYPTMFLLLPVLDKNRNAIAAVSLRLNPYDTINYITNFGYRGTSGEIYMFDRNARLLTESRFESELREKGLLDKDKKSILNVEIRDPGERLNLDYISSIERSKHPFTYMIQQAFSGNNKVNLTSYRDYRGVSVLGSWYWDKDLQIGIAAEIDEAEAMASFIAMRNLILITLLLTVILISIIYFIYILTTNKYSEKIQRSESFLNNLLNDAMVGIVTIDEKGLVKTFNKHAENIFGYSADEVLGNNISMLMPDDFKAQHDGYLNNYFRTGKGNLLGKITELSACRKDGSIFPIQIAINKLNINDEINFTGIIQDLTDIKHKTEVLERSEKSLTEAQSIAKIGSWDLDIVNDKLYWSEQMFFLWGLKPQETPVQYQTFIDGVHPYDRERVQQAIDDAWQNKKEYNVEYRVLNSDGTIRNIFARANMSFDEKYNPVRMTGIVMDISERKLQQLELEKSEQMLLQAQLTAKMGNWDYSLETGKVYCSEGFRHLWGLDTEADTFVLTDLMNSIHPDDIDNVNQAIGNAVAEQENYDIEYRVINKGGIERIIHAQGSTYCNAEGTVIGMDGIVIDISDRVAKEKELKISEQRLLEAQRLAHMGSWEMHYVDNKLYWSDESFRLWGYEPQKDPITYEMFADRLHPDDKERVQHEIESAMNEEREYKIDYRLILPDGIKKDIYAQGGVIRDSRNNIIGMSGIVLDITDRKKSERSIIEAGRLAAESNRAKSEFLAMMSHEIRTPLNAVIGMSELALKTELTEKQRNYIYKSHSSAQSLLNIINDVLDFSKIEAGQVELEDINFNLNDVLEKLTHIVGMKAQEKNLEFIFDISSDVPTTLIGDPTRITQILINLGSNAVKFTKVGEVTLRIRAERIDDADAVSVSFEMIDTGIGIEKEKQADLFNDFRQADSSVTRQYGGTGLGLSISKRLVELMGGEIQFDSTVDIGSNFKFTLNLKCGHGEPLPLHALPEGVENLRVLIVDDNESARLALNDIMLSFGFRTHLCSSGWEAIKELKDADKKQRSYGLILVDWKMPEFDGLQTVREIFEHDLLTNAPVVLMVTAYSVDELMEQVGTLPINEVLVKPINPSVMLDTTLRALGQKGFLPKGEIPLLSTTSRNAMELLAGTHVLLVEDNIINQELAIELLTEAGILTEVVNNGQEALDILQEKTFDAVLMDVHMPVMDGFTATQKIKAQERFKDLPVIAMTANALSGDRQRCLDAGMTDYLSKPINIQKMLVTLVQAIKHQEVEIETPMVLFKDVVTEGKLPVMPNIDTKEGLFVCNNNINLYRRLLRKFLMNESFPSDFLKALDSSDTDTASRLAHTLKGSAGIIGAKQLHKLSENLQQLCDDNRDFELIKPVFDNVVDELSIVIGSLKSFYTTEDNELGTPVSFGNEQLNSITTSLMELLKDNNTEAADYFVQLKSSLEVRGMEEELKELTSFVDQYDFDSAVTSLEDIMAKLNK